MNPNLTRSRHLQDDVAALAQLNQQDQPSTYQEVKHRLTCHMSRSIYQDYFFRETSDKPLTDTPSLIRH